MSEAVFDAEIVEDESSSMTSDTRSLNAVLGGTIAIAIVFLLMSKVIGTIVEEFTMDESMVEYVPIEDRYKQDFVTDGSHSYILENGTLTGPEGAQLWSGTHHFVDFELPIEEGGAAPNGKVSLAVWIPDVPEGTTVPVIAEFGPYFDEASVETPGIEEPGTWLGTMILEQIVPHGFAFAQVSVMGCLLYTSPSPRD